MKTAIIVDLDGTLCNTDGRKHFVENKPKDWKSFFAGISNDEPNEWCRQLVYSVSKRHDIVFVSGRAEEYRGVSHVWLHDHLGPVFAACPLFMRADGDFRQDYIIKEEIYRKHIEPHYKILFCVDDRKQVVDMWRRIGLQVLHCAEGDF